jgi:hypothetical protein
VVRKAAATAADAEEIESVLGRYRLAFAALDVDAARAVWPGVNAPALERTFDQLREQRLEFQTCTIVVIERRATADCRGRARYVSKVGSRSVHDERRQWTFNLRRTPESWVIANVSWR